MDNPATFLDIAAELELVAHREAFGAELLEIEAARHPTTAIFQAGLLQARDSAKLTAQAARIFRRLASIEAQVRQLLNQDNETGDGE